MLATTLTLLALSAATQAHFRLIQPYWRGDSFADDASQWSWPCANVSQANSSTNRTSWPLTGGSVVLSSSHEWVQTFVNLGLGDEVTGFNVSLLAAYNTTGNGTVCFPRIGAGILDGLELQEGQTASLQVVHVGERGNALYNCADIVFSANATILEGDACTNSTGIGGYYLEEATVAGADGGESGSATTSGAASSSTAAGSDASSSRNIGVAAVVGAAAVAVGVLLM